LFLHWAATATEYEVGMVHGGWTTPMLVRLTKTTIIVKPNSSHLVASNLSEGGVGYQRFSIFSTLGIYYNTIPEKSIPRDNPSSTAIGFRILINVCISTIVFSTASMRLSRSLNSTRLGIHHTILATDWSIPAATSVVSGNILGGHSGLCSP